jgi:hypothetical protein
MSVTYHVFARSSRLPTASAWADAIARHGSQTRIGTDFDLLSHSGYLPCPDDRTGFELYVEPYSPASFEIGPDGIRAVADRDTMLTFRCSGREVDREAAMDAAAALAAMTDGILYDSDSRHFIDAASALAWARRERYAPVAIYRLRASRRRSRLRLSTVLRLLIIIALAVTAFVFAT